MIWKAVLAMLIPEGNGLFHGDEIGKKTGSAARCATPTRRTLTRRRI